MRFLTAGESHGEELTGIIEGLPSGLSVSAAFINDDLRRRRTAVGRGERMGLEHDEVRITSGLFDGVTTGAPMTLHIKNADNSGKRDFDFIDRDMWIMWGISNTVTEIRHLQAKEAAPEKPLCARR